MQGRLAAWLAEWLEPAEELASLTAIELGAGDGLFTEYLTPRCPELTATDIACRMIDEGRRRLPHVAWRIADAWRLQCPPVDRLYSASLLHWCADPAAVLRRWRRLVKPNGRMLHGFYVAPTLAEWDAVAGGHAPVQWRSASQWEALFRETGWQVIRAETRELAQRFRSALEFLRFLHRTGAVPPRRTPVTRLRRMIHEYERTVPAPDGLPGVVSNWTFFRIETSRC